MPTEPCRVSGSGYYSGLGADCDGIVDPLPGLVTDLLRDDVMLDWNPGADATRFDVVAGDLNRYRLTGSLTDAITGCAGDGSCDTSGTGQAAPRDAAIAASVDSCP